MPTGEPLGRMDARREFQLLRALTLIRKAPRSCSIVPTDPADLEMLDSVLIMLERSCGKLARSLSTLRKVSGPALRHLESGLVARG
jgi:hypothetical protein